MKSLSIQMMPAAKDEFRNFFLFPISNKQHNSTKLDDKSYLLVFKLSCLVVMTSVYDDHTLFMTLCLSVRECSIILKIWQTFNFDMGFQKNDLRKV
jgi:hypothetical protein